MIRLQPIEGSDVEQAYFIVGTLLPGIFAGIRIDNCRLLVDRPQQAIVDGIRQFQDSVPWPFTPVYPDGSTDITFALDDKTHAKLRAVILDLVD